MTHETKTETLKNLFTGKFQIAGVHPNCTDSGMETWLVFIEHMTHDKILSIQIEVAEDPATWLETPIATDIEV